jgi:hypothetical protein
VLLQYGAPHQPGDRVRVTLNLGRLVVVGAPDVGDPLTVVVGAPDVGDPLVVVCELVSDSDVGPMSLVDGGMVEV